MANTNTACYEGIQRIFRNTIVGHVRARFVAQYGAEAPARAKKPFAKEWDQIAADAAARRVSGELGTELQDAFDLLGVNHFFNLFDVAYDVLVPADAALDERQKPQNRQALLAWLKTIKNLRDPLSHPSDAEFAHADAFTLLDSARRVLARLGFTEQADRLAALRDGVAGGASAGDQPLETYLPPREAIVTDFVGRRGELKILWRWFEDPLARRWALAGDGGKGKSALAYAFATEVSVRAVQPYQMVLWLSAKRKRFVDGAVSTIGSPDFSNIDSALAARGVRPFGDCPER